MTAMTPLWSAMSLHPKYYEAFVALHAHLVEGHGALKTAEIHFIAIMALGQHGCHRLMEHHSELFLKTRGLSQSETKWLEGLEKASKRLRALNKLNALIAHQPWRVDSEVIRELISSPLGRDKWSMSELMQAVVILAHFHCLASFAMGCGHLHDDDNVAVANDDFVMSVDDEHHEEVELVMRKMANLQMKQEELEEDEVAKRFHNLEVAEKEEIFRKAKNQKLGNKGTKIKTDVNKAIDEESAGLRQLQYSIVNESCVSNYVDFVSREEPIKFPTFKIHDFSWSVHGFPTLSQLLSEEMSQLLDSKFRLIKELTYMSIGKYEAVDTTVYRRAVQNYVQCLYGIRHDDYDYHQVNELLARPLKKYIKTLCCFPELCTLADYQSIMPDFKESEKIHVCLLACEARFQSSLLYALRAIQSHFSSPI